MYVLHIGNKNYSSWSLRAWVLLRQLGIPFEERFHQFPPDGPSYPSFRKFSPSGLVPVLDNGAAKIWESLGIIEYLAERHHGVWSADQDARDWSRSAAAEMHGGFSNLRNICGMNCGIRVTLPGIAAGLQRDLDRLDELWNDGLSRFGGPFLAGKSFSAVDAFFCPVAFRIQTYGLKLSDKAMAYATRLLELSAMKEWYAAAIAEDFREPGHENDHIAAGAWTADYRAKPKAS
jgi:glutathione S-transferase